MWHTALGTRNMVEGSHFRRPLQDQGGRAESEEGDRETERKAWGQVECHRTKSNTGHKVGPLFLVTETLRLEVRR